MLRHFLLDKLSQLAAVSGGVILIYSESSGKVQVQRLALAAKELNIT